MFVEKLMLYLLLPNSNFSELMVEETNGQYVELEIRRSFGGFGDIMVTLESVEGSAVSPSGRKCPYNK